MNYCLIYFVVALFILVAKFVQALATINKLKTFIVNNKSVIEQETVYEHDVYIRLFILHMGRFSYGESYEKSMIDNIKNHWSSIDLFEIIMFAFAWPLAVPVVLVCLLFGYCHKLLNKFLRNILDENGKYEQLP